MKKPGLSALTASALMIGLSLLIPLSVQAQDCPLQIRCSGFTPAKYYTVLKISFASTTSCTGVRAAVEWSDDLVTWNPVHQPGGWPCVTSGTEVQVIEETDARYRRQRFYRVRHAGSCP